jgi:hypothetical protein
LLASSLASACGMNEEPTIFTSSPLVEPRDLTTNVGQRPRMTVAFGNAEQSQQVAAVAAQLVLARLDDLSEVPIRVQHTSTNIIVDVDRDLDDAWHVLAIRTLPDNVKPTVLGAPNPPLGAYAVRFHPSSMPTLAEVEVCADATDPKAPTTVDVVFSEAMDPASFDAVQVLAGNSGCEPVNDPNRDPLGFSLSCPSGSGLGPYDIGLQSGMIAASGKELALFDGSTTLSAMFSVHLNGPLGAHSCPAWKPF